MDNNIHKGREQINYDIGEINRRYRVSMSGFARKEGEEEMRSSSEGGRSGATLGTRRWPTRSQFRSKRTSIVITFRKATRVSHHPPGFH